MPAETWTPERDAEVRRMKEEGYSTSQIAAAIGQKFNILLTRSAVIGRAARLGLCVKKLKASDRQHTPEKARIAHIEIEEIKADAPKLKRIRRAKPGKYTVGPMTQSVAPPDLSVVEPEPLRCVEIEPRHLSLFDLKEDNCRYPYGGWPENTPVTFCAHPKRDGSSYCAVHAELVAAPRGPYTRRSEDGERRRVTAIKRTIHGGKETLHRLADADDWMGRT